MKTNRIQWHQTDRDLKCECGQPANDIAVVGWFKIPVCPECGRMNETEIFNKAVKQVVKGFETEGKTPIK